MFHLYDGYHWAGMHLIWWGFWLVFIGIAFRFYEPLPRNRSTPDTRP